MTTIGILMVLGIWAFGLFAAAALAIDVYRGVMEMRRERRAAELEKEALRRDKADLARTVQRKLPAPP